MSISQPYDKQIQQLLKIKLGLQQRSQVLFKQLISGSKQDPLSEMINSMIKKNQNIKQLKQQVLKLQKQNTDLRKNKTLSPFGGSPSKESQRTKSLPSEHQRDMKIIQQKKKSLNQQKKRYIQKTQSFIIFLLDCIRLISKSKIQVRSDTQVLIKRLEGKLNEFKNRVFQLQNQKQRLTTTQSSSYSRQNLSQQQRQYQKTKQNQYFQNLIKQLKQKKDPQGIFEKVHQRLGLKQVWNQYISKLKSQSDMYKMTKQVIFGTQSPQIKKKDKLTYLQEQKQKYLLKIKNRHTQSSWSQQIMQKMKDVERQTSRENTQNYLNQLLQKTRRQQGNHSNQIQQVLVKCFQYFFIRLDILFEKHNQNPYQITSTKSYEIFKQSIKGLIEQKLWAKVLQKVKSQVDSAFYYIERRTKFYSCNRVLVRNNH